jgi:hypothetical protein
VETQLWVASWLRTLNSMNALQHHAFTQLLAAWRRRDDARRHGDIRELADARLHLDAARAQSRSTLDPLR